MDTPNSSFLTITAVSLLVLCLSGCSCGADSTSFYNKEPKRDTDFKDSLEEVIQIFGPEKELYLSISLKSWGAIFYQGCEEIGSLRYDRTYYDLTDPEENLIWKMMAHDTKVVVFDAKLNPEISIVRRRDKIEFFDAKGMLLFHIDKREDGFSLFRVSENPEGPDEIIATAMPTDKGISVSNAGGDIKYLTDSEISPLGIVTIMLPGYDLLEKSALVIMVK